MLAGARAEGAISVLDVMQRAKRRIRQTNFGDFGDADGTPRLDGTRGRLCLSPEGCSRAASFGVAPPGGRCGPALYCARHKEPDHVYVRRRRCEHPAGCTKAPTHGEAGARRATLCRTQPRQLTSPSAPPRPRSALCPAPPPSARLHRVRKANARYARRQASTRAPLSGRSAPRAGAAASAERRRRTAPRATLRGRTRGGASRARATRRVDTSTSNSSTRAARRRAGAPRPPRAPASRPPCCPVAPYATLRGPRRVTKPTCQLLPRAETIGAIFLSARRRRAANPPRGARVSAAAPCGRRRRPQSSLTKLPRAAAHTRLRGARPPLAARAGPVRAPLTRARAQLGAPAARGAMPAPRRLRAGRDARGGRARPAARVPRARGAGAARRDACGVRGRGLRGAAALRRRAARARALLREAPPDGVRPCVAARGEPAGRAGGRGECRCGRAQGTGRAGRAVGRPGGARQGGCSRAGRGVGAGRWGGGAGRCACARRRAATQRVKGLGECGAAAQRHTRRRALAQLSTCALACVWLRGACCAVRPPLAHRRCSARRARSPAPLFTEAPVWAGRSHIGSYVQLY